MADFIVTSGIKLAGNIYGADNITANSITIANTGVFGNLRIRGSVTANIIGSVSSLDNFTTSNLLEGFNLYFTGARAVTAITPLLTTANVVENTNLYFTNTRVLAALATSNVSVNNLYVGGDLIVQGNTVALSAATLNVEDKNILLANGAPNAAAADGGGITIAGANASITYASTGDKFIVNKPVDVQGNLNVTGNAFINSDPVITLNPLNQSLALLRAQLEASPENVLYVAKHGNDNNSGSSMSNAIANIHVALARANSWTTVFVKSGDYTLYNQPVTIKQRVGMVGDNLRTTTIRPSNVTADMFYVENASYVTGITFRDHQSPAAVFSYNPDGSAGFIVTSPYIQNCSSITTTGTGMRVNGAYVTGLRSMVCDSYTQTNTGGIGIHMLNRGYTQLVSVFTICCHIAILAENGGFCSVTNSNSSFGDYGLVADGVSDPLKFGKVVGDTTGQTFTINNIGTRPNYRDAILFANYDQAKCLRDTKLIVDSLAIDLAYGSNTQSTFSALQYWAQADSAIPNQSVQIIDALDYLAYMAGEIASNADPIFEIYRANTDILPITGPTGTVAEQTIVQDRVNLVANIIASGTVGVTDRIISNQFPASSNVNINNAANVLILNKNFMSAEIIGYIDAQYPGFFDQANNFIDPAHARATCSRDIGYIIDCVAFDLRHGGNRQSIQAGTYYYTYNANDTQINDQVVQTGKAYDYIGSIIDEIVTRTPIQGYDQVKCSRDIGLIIDSLNMDLIYNSNSQSNFAALQYWSQSESAIPNQATETVAAINFAKSLAFNIAKDVNVSAVYQANVSPDNGIGGLPEDANTVANLFVTITDIITNGTAGVTDKIISNQWPPEQSDPIGQHTSNAANLIISNKAFIAAETIGYINTTYPNFWANVSHFVDPANALAKCSRDVGYILESVAFDLRHGGNRQSIQSGTYYYNYNANVTQINNQVVATGAAYNYMGKLISDVVRANTVAKLYQTSIAQNTTAASAASYTQANSILQDINLITNIITNGPSVAQPKTPIFYSNAAIASNVANASKLLIANKDFIKAETIAYINEVLFDPPYQTQYLQNTIAAAAATLAQANAVLNNISLIKNIVTNGPSVAPAKTPISYYDVTDSNVINAVKLILANKDYISAEVVSYVNQNWANISNGAATFYTVSSSTEVVGNTCTITLLENVPDTIKDGSTVSFHIPSYIQTSTHTFEYIGAGTDLARALPYNGGTPIQSNEVKEYRGGAVYFTSTDQQGDFRIGKELLINRVDGTITGRTFNKSLFAVMTPYLLAIEG